MPRPRRSSSVGSANEGTTATSSIVVVVARKVTTAAEQRAWYWELLMAEPCLHHPKTPLHILAGLLKRARELDETNISDKNSNTPAACTKDNNKDNNNNEEVITSSFHHQLIKQFVHPESGYTPLHAALIHEHLGKILLWTQCKPMPFMESFQVRDYEGFTPLQLVGHLQRNELRQCREALRQKEMKQNNHFIITSNNNNNNSEQDELDELTGNMHLLQDQDDDDDEHLLLRDRNSSHFACDVVTFGRADPCVLGGGSLSSSSNNTGSNNSSNGGSVRLQRLPHFFAGRVRHVAASTYHTLVLTEQGELFAFGVNKNGRLGTGDDEGQTIMHHVAVPKRVSLNAAVATMCAAENHSLCVTTEGHVYAWGSNRFGQVVGMSSSSSSSSPPSCATVSYQATPRRVEGLKHATCIKVAAGLRHSVVLSHDGQQVFCWGDNTSGQVGSLRKNTHHRVHKAIECTTTSLCRIVDIAASEHATLMVGESREGRSVVYNWGHGSHTPMALPSNHHHTRHRNNQIIAIASAKHHHAYLTAKGQVYTWGFHADTLGHAATSTPPSKRSNSTEGEHFHNSAAKTKPRRKVGGGYYSTPQLVQEFPTGHGVAVALSACEDRTVCVTECGALVTWGASSSKSVLGHEGVRWQPHPRRVPGVYRAVGVAAAKEHTVVMLGVSIPPIPELPSSSLELLAARQVANHVNVSNVFPLLITADRCHCVWLKEYCEEFIRRNIDGALHCARKQDMERYLQEQLQDGTNIDEQQEQVRCRDGILHPVIWDLLGLRGSAVHQSSSAMPHSDLCHAEDQLLASLPLSLRAKLDQIKNGSSSSGRSKQRPRSKSRSCSLGEDNNIVATDNNNRHQVVSSGCSERCQTITSRMDLSSREAVQQTHDILGKELRGVKKKMAQISKLLHKQPLSIQEREKVARRPLLEADASMLETALKDVERRMRQYNLKPGGEKKKEEESVQASESGEAECSQQEDESSDGACKASTRRLGECPSQGIGPSVEKSKLLEKASCWESSPPKSSKEESHQESTPAQSKTQATVSLRCEICKINCPDERSFELHKNGRKHRNRVAQVAEDEKQAAISVMEHQQRQQAMLSESAKTPPIAKQTRNPWQTEVCVQPRYRLPSPPHGAKEIVVVPAKSPATRKKWSLAPRLLDATPKPSEEKKKPANFRQILEEEESKKLASRKKKSSAAVVESPRPLQLPPNAAPPMKSPPWAAAPVVVSRSEDITHQNSYSLGDFLGKPSSSSNDQGKSKENPRNAPWLPQQEAVVTDASVPPARRSILEIQQEEECLKGRHNHSFGGKWYVERREKTGSLEEIQKNAEKERAERLFIEEQKRIEEQIMKDLALQKEREQKSKKPKASNNKKKKGRPQKGGDDTQTGNRQRNNHRKKRPNQKKPPSEPSAQSCPCSS